MSMSRSLPRRLRLPAVFAATAAALVAAVLTATAARADVLFSDNFEQPTVNVWQTGGGGSWSVVSEDGTKVFRQSNTTVDTVAWAGSGAGPFTVVTAKVKPTSSLASGTVALLSKVANPNNYYYVGLHAGRLEVGRRSGGTISALAYTTFAASTGTWYNLTLNLFMTGTISGSVSPVAGGTGASVSAPDPGGTNFGSKVGFWTASASASFDDIKLSDDRITPTSSPATRTASASASPSTSPSTSPSAACPVTITYSIVNSWPGSFQAAIVVRNNTATLIPAGWTITFRFNNGEQVANMFSVASWTQVGALVSLVGPVWAPLNPNSSFQFGFIGASTNPPGTSISNVTFNGVPC